MKKRLDVLLFEKGLVESRSKAQALVMAGTVLVNGIKITKAGTQVSDEDLIEIEKQNPYVSRGGLKLESVLNMRFLKPFDEQAIKDILKYTNKIVTVEEGSLIGGMGETVKSVLSGTDVKIYSIGLPDKFIEHGKQKLIRELCGLSAENIETQVLNLLNR